MKKQKSEPVRCYDCKLAYLMQSVKYNPIVAECSITKERNVSSTLLFCNIFKERKEEPTIHKMIYL